MGRLAGGPRPPPPSPRSNLAVALASAWGGEGDDGAANRQHRRRRTADQARLAAVERAAAAAAPAPKRAKERHPTAAPDVEPERLAADRVKAVLATADVDRTTLRDVIARVALEGGARPAPPRRVVQATVDDVLAGGGGEGDAAGAGALLGGWARTATAAAAAAAAVPAGLAGDALAAYLDLRATNPPEWTVTIEDELALPLHAARGDASLQAALDVAAALRRAGASPAGAQAAARAVHATAIGVLNEAWMASRRKGQGAASVWGGLFRPPCFLPDAADGGGGVLGDTVEPRPVKGGVDVPAATASKGNWAPRASAAFGALAPRAPAPPPSPAPAADDDGGAAAVFDWAARSGVRGGVVRAAAARLRGGD